MYLVVAFFCTKPMTDITPFIQYLESERRASSHTVDAYKRDVNQFYDYLHSLHNTDEKDISPQEVTSHMVRDWIMGLAEEGLAHRTINRKISSLNAYFQFLMRVGDVEGNPLKTISRLKQPHRIVEALRWEEVEAVLNPNLYESDYKGILDKTLMTTLYYTGMRRAEIIDLPFEKVDLNGKLLRVIGKRKKERLVPVHPELAAVLQSFVKVREQFHGNQRGTFFLTEEGGSLTPNLVYERVNYYLSMATSIDVKSPHLLRHTFATHLLNNGAELNTIKELLGHANLSATEIYTHNSIEKIKSVYNQAFPKRK